MCICVKCAWVGEVNETTGKFRLWEKNKLKLPCSKRDSQLNSCNSLLAIEIAPVPVAKGFCLFKEFFAYMIQFESCLS